MPCTHLLVDEALAARICGRAPTGRRAFSPALRQPLKHCICWLRARKAELMPLGDNPSGSGLRGASSSCYCCESGETPLKP